MLTEEDALTELDDEQDCSYCQNPYAAHCQQCWHCPGTHDEMCGW